MQHEVTIREERSNDIAAVTDVVMRAYADIPYSDHREHIMVERQRASAAYVPGLSLLAVAVGVIIGHVLLTTATIGCGEDVATTLALAPLSVVPGH